MDMSIDIKSEEIQDVLKQLTRQDFLHVGMDQIAYINNSSDGMFSIHAADGSQISIMDSYDTALAAIHINDLQAVTLH
jgi:hypothetical protein